MTHPEYRPAPNTLQREIFYSDPRLGLYPLATSTNQVFTNYFMEGRRPDGVARNILGDTLAFIHNARAGLADNPNEVDRLGLAKPNDLRTAQAIDGGPTVTDDEALEAIRFSLITMGAIHKYTTISFRDTDGKYHDFRFTRNGMMAPPETLIEASMRLRELWRETEKVAMGETRPYLHIMGDPAKLRTFFFWRTAAQIAIPA